MKIKQKVEKKRERTSCDGVKETKMCWKRKNGVYLQRSRMGWAGERGAVRGLSQWERSIESTTKTERVLGLSREQGKSKVWGEKF